ncbi:hypothetical protein R3J21_02440 [Citrobacter werkmanii]|uniref:hypothetical protein n=1 Tax=Citrobacter TaxID=544 RepID=UPI0005022FD1|nr:MULTISPECIES: hypothetical protein [Citrobacter]MDV7070400.1 hypothetical protein [Citrobacter werkmanii]TKU71179.1 hypothetical protein FDX14_17705 [Citrobacter sp. wls710]TKU75794.1 hypothetical protein FDW92_08205 [Citrobacter sp. wls706]UCA26567.1 hypothetical protein LA356_07585 [Citrobacter werkmanii]GAL43577.1 hypothetical protein CIWKM_03_02540 [Citrobacter werkmanii NBRC 105721]
MNNKIFGVVFIATLSAGLAFSTHASETISKTEVRTLVDENNKFKVVYDIDDKGKVINIRFPDGVVDADTKQKITREMESWAFEAGNPQTDVSSMVTLKLTTTSAHSRPRDASDGLFVLS